jgi:hypothetical protein
VTVSKALQLESFGHAHCEWLVDQGGLARRHNLDYVFGMTVVGSRDDGGIYFVVGQTSFHRVGASLESVSRRERKPLLGRSTEAVDDLDGGATGGGFCVGIGPTTGSDNPQSGSLGHDWFEFDGHV